ncbi:hypothetical protein ASG73_11210 [Janibacter sp. Soil728]|uniref:DUF4349 domain-containing protein n=1 Tax=Janibacter sp. Soil728 TaxID=1736393 RepID=UPI0007022222|nr:DUF4349 domain-containing protein [Janibacter sp. Soil728]KRE36894.1 hypothetical protein ASG73_11210 [Janibacter sp. Soil728]
MTRTTHGRWAALVAAGGLALTGCAVGSDSGASSEGGDSVPHQSQARGGDSDARPESAASSASGGQGKGSGDSGSGSSAASGYKAPADARIARTASLSLTVEDLEQAAAKVRSTARTAGGYVSDEDSRAATYEGGRSWAEITITVPVDKLDSTTTDLSELGKVTKRASSAEDLTSQYTDTTARVRTKTKSVERLRTLIDSTDDLDQIVTLERELSTREADLESMTSQQKSLEQRTATAPITVSLSTDATGTDASEEEASGFVAGLSEGWGAFTSALTVGLTALGAITPFALTGLVLLAPGLWWLRRRTTRPAPVVATTDE